MQKSPDLAVINVPTPKQVGSSDLTQELAEWFPDPRFRQSGCHRMAHPGPLPAPGRPRINAAGPSGQRPQSPDRSGNVIDWATDVARVKHRRRPTPTILICVLNRPLRRPAPLHHTRCASRVSSSRGWQGVPSPTGTTAAGRRSPSSTPTRAGWTSTWLVTCTSPIAHVLSAC